MVNVQIASNAGHDHCAVLDDAGNGWTTMDAGHQHQVVGGRVALVFNHSHNVASVAGQPAACQRQYALAGAQPQQQAPGQPKKPCNCGKK